MSEEHNQPRGSANGPTPPEDASDHSGFNDEPISAELLSAYLDDPDDLQPDVRARIERELETNLETREMLRELEVVVHELRALPRVDAPRSYHLTPEMTGAREPVRLEERRPWYLRHTEAVRWATAAAAILFVLVFTADLVTNGIGPGSPNGDADDTVMQSDTSEPSTLRAADDDAAAESAGEAQIMLATEASGEAEAIPEEEAAGGGEPTPAGAEAGEAPADAAGGGESAVEEPEMEADTAEEEPTALIAVATEADGGASDEDAPVALEAPEVTVTDAPEDLRPGGDEAGVEPTAGSATDSASSGQPEAFSMAPEKERQGDSNDRTTWRAVEFSLIFILAVLLSLMIIQSRLDRATAGSRGGRR